MVQHPKTVVTVNIATRSRVLYLLNTSPITTICGSRDGQVAKSIPWTAFSLSAADWERVKDMHAIISDANYVQQCFSAEQHPTLWHVVPVLEELQTSWEGKRADPRYEPYHLAIDCGLAKIGKYYNQLDDKPVCILALGRSTSVIYQQRVMILDSAASILHGNT